jgi:hypothetical protein
MGDTISNHPAQTPWRQLCEVAVLERNPEKLPERIAEARVSVLHRLEGGFQTLSEGEQLALQDALEMLHVLEDDTKREIAEQQRTAS